MANGRGTTARIGGNVIAVVAGSPLGARSAQTAVAHALVEVYNPAQLRALKRVGEILDGRGE
jgi:hypothetical protein